VKRAGLAVVVVAVAGLLSACLPAAPAPAPPTVQSVTKGFDACAAPTSSTMGTWKSGSPYSAIGIYIGGVNRGCAQPNLTRSWISSVWGQGWNLLPIWVGAQAPCSNLRTTKLSGDTSVSFFEGINEAAAAADAADSLGFGWLTPIYYDLEAYPRGGDCTVAIQRFTDGWVAELNARGYQAAMYSSLCSGILDQQAAIGVNNHKALNAVWIAAWNDDPGLFGFGPPCRLDDGLWWDHQRAHQYTGGHNESYGGITINVDSNSVDGPTAR
jgi:hypothetical protein